MDKAGVAELAVGFSLSYALDDMDAHNRNSLVAQFHAPLSSDFTPYLFKVHDAVGLLKKKVRLGALRQELATMQLQVPQVHADYDRLIQAEKKTTPGRKLTEKDKQDRERARVTVDQWDRRIEATERLIMQYEKDLAEYGSSGTANRNASVQSR